MFGPRMDEGEIGRASEMKDETAAVSKTQTDPWTPYGDWFVSEAGSSWEKRTTGRGSAVEEERVGKGGVQLQR